MKIPFRLQPQNHLKFHPFILGVLLCVLLLLSLTSWYGISYVLAIVFFTNRIKTPSSFRSFFARLLVTTLVLTVCIMIVGIIAWLFQTQTYPLGILALFLLLCSLLSVHNTNQSTHSPILDKTDIISISLASVALIVMVLSFYFPRPSHAATIQILTNGFDNLAHLTLLRTNGVENNYAYGDYQLLKDRVIVQLSSYPQGWHLASAHIINGFGDNQFSESSPLKLMYLYLSSVTVWYFIAVYFLMRVAAYVANIFTKRGELGDLTIFIASALMIQVIVYWGSLGLGFASFLGCLAFLAFFVGCILDFEKKLNNKIFGLAALATVGLSQTWILPAVGALIGMVALIFYLNKATLSVQKRHILRDTLYKPYIPVLFAVSLVVTFQFSLLFLFPLRNSTSTLLNEEGGIFGISLLLLHIFLLGATYFWFNTKKLSDIPHIAQKIVILCYPIFLMAITIYCYQIVVAGKASYFFTKTALLAMVIAWIFFTPIIIKVLRTRLGGSYKNLGAIVGIVVVFSLISATGQPIDNINHLVQRHSKLEFHAAEHIVNYLKTDEYRSARFVMLKSQDDFVEDADSTYFANRFIFKPDLCVNDINVSGHSLGRRLSNLSRCAKNTPEKIVVVSTRETSRKIEQAGLTNISYIPY